MHPFQIPCTSRPSRPSSRPSSRWRTRLIGLSVPLLGFAAGDDAAANHYAMSTTQFLDRQHLQTTIQTNAASNIDITEMAVTPNGNWIVVTGKKIEYSPGFDAACRAKVQEYVSLGLDIDAIAFAPNGGWMVIAEHLAWHSAGLSYVATLEAKILERINAGKRIDDLAFDADGSGWTLLSEGWAHSVSIPSDLYAAIVERHKSKRSIQQVEIGPDGRWVLLADDWYASDALSSSAISWLKSFQRNQWGLDKVMLGLGGNYVLFENASFVPDMNDPMQAIEYGLAKNLWTEMSDRKIAGVSIAVIENFEVKWARTYGEIEAGSQRFLRADTPMDTASVSKPLAAMTVMSLVEDGVMSLDTNLQAAAVMSYYKFGFPYWSPLFTWLVYGASFQNGLPIPATQMTLRRLLSHSASLDPWGSTSYKPGDKLPSTMQMLFGHNSNGNSESYGGGNMVWYNPFILGDNTPTPPGTTYRYSGGGFLAAQAMAESLTLAPFTALAQSRVLDVLDMDDSTYVQPLVPAFAARASAPHDANGVAVAVNQRPIYTWAAAGGLYSTPTDLAKATIALMSQGIGPNGAKVLEPSTVAAMLSKQAAGGTKYGLGLSLSANSVTNANQEWFTHNGGHTYATARLAGNPALGSGIAILISSGSDDASVLRDDLFARFQTVYGW